MPDAIAAADLVRQFDRAAPADRAEEVTPSDSAPLSRPCRALYVGGAGDLVVVTAGGDTVTFADVPAGTVLPVRVVKVLAATTATAVVAIS